MVFIHYFLRLTENVPDTPERQIQISQDTRKNCGKTVPSDIQYKIRNNKNRYRIPKQIPHIIPRCPIILPTPKPAVIHPLQQQIIAESSVYRSGKDVPHNKTDTTTHITTVISKEPPNHRLARIMRPIPFCSIRHLL